MSRIPKPDARSRSVKRPDGLSKIPSPPAPIVACHVASLTCSRHEFAFSQDSLAYDAVSYQNLTEELAQRFVAPGPRLKRTEDELEKFCGAFIHPNRPEQSFTLFEKSASPMSTFELKIKANACIEPCGMAEWDEHSEHSELIEMQKLCLSPMKSLSPNLINDGEEEESSWLTERVSVALNELLTSLRIHPEIASSSHSDEVHSLSNVSRLVDSDSLIGKNLALVRSSNEGKLSIQSHPLSTCSV